MEGGDLKRITLATFWLKGDRIISEYADPAYEQAIERDGIFSPNTGCVWPKDGRAFYEALDVEYANSSWVYVIDE